MLLPAVAATVRKIDSHISRLSLSLNTFSLYVYVTQENVSRLLQDLLIPSGRNFVLFSAVFLFLFPSKFWLCMFPGKRKEAGRRT